MKKLIFLTIIQIILGQSNIYNKQENVDVNSITYQTVLINKHKVLDKISCILECNKNTSCLTSTYTLNSPTKENCFLYNIYFTQSQLQTSPSSSVFIKTIKNTNITNSCTNVTTFSDTACLKNGISYLTNKLPS
jgi:hypothetical protein